MLHEVKCKKFLNGIVYALKTEDGYPIEVTDTFCLTTRKMQLEGSKIILLIMNLEVEVKDL